MSEQDSTPDTGSDAPEAERSTPDTTDSRLSLPENWKSLAIIAALILLVVIFLSTRGCGNDDEQPKQSDTQTTSLPPASSQTTTTPTLVEDLEAIAGYFPGVQLNSASAPFVCTVDIETLDDKTQDDLKAAAIDEMQRDGVKLKEVTLQNLTIVISESGDRFTGFIARATGILEDDSSLESTDIYIGDGSWTPQRSADFARALRQEVENNPLYGMNASGGGHRVRLIIGVPHHRPVDDD